MPDVAPVTSARWPLRLYLADIDMRVPSSSISSRVHRVIRSRLARTSDVFAWSEDQQRGRAAIRARVERRSSSRLNARVEVCGGERAPRPEAFPELVDLLDRRRRIEPPDLLDRVAEGEVSPGPDIGPAQREHQHSIGGEPSDALDLGKCAPGVVVVEGEQATEVKPSVLEPCGEIV